VFDPPPEALSIPWTYLAVILGFVVVSIVAAVLSAGPSTTLDIRNLRDL